MLVHVPGDPVAVGQHVRVATHRPVTDALQGQPGLPGERAQQVQVLFVEGGGPAAADGEQHPGRGVVGAQRHRRRRPGPDSEAVSDIERQVRHVVRDVAGEHRAGSGPAIGMVRPISAVMSRPSPAQTATVNAVTSATASSSGGSAMRV